MYYILKEARIIKHFAVVRVRLGHGIQSKVVIKDLNKKDVGRFNKPTFPSFWLG
jgi:hypothetical protein